MTTVSTFITLISLPFAALSLQCGRVNEEPLDICFNVVVQNSSFSKKTICNEEGEFIRSYYNDTSCEGVVTDQYTMDCDAAIMDCVCASGFACDYAVFKSYLNHSICDGDYIEKGFVLNQCLSSPKFLSTREGSALPYAQATCSRNNITVDLCDNITRNDFPFFIEACELKCVNYTRHTTPDPKQNHTKSSIPTVKFTYFPSPDPTADPTATRTETVNPTHFSSVNPTHGPSVEPTELSTNAPTTNPTHGPSVEPTKLSTNAPTANPTHGPSVEPTANPTRGPSVEPTESFTNPPTANPVSLSTVFPTSNPTYFPIVDVTETPTSNPSADIPTSFPSLNPVSYTSYEPTYAQSEAVYISSSNPTEIPTSNPITHEKRTTIHRIPRRKYSRLIRKYPQSASSQSKSHQNVDASNWRKKRHNLQRKEQDV